MQPYITINGKPFPFPKRGLPNTVVTIVDAGRAANGRIIAQRVGRDQYKLNLSWPYLKAAVWAEMMQEFEKFDLVVEFPDMVSGKWKRLRMYPGDRSAEPFMLGDDGLPLSYVNCNCNLIDRGEDEL